jgi:hypothetical protein
MTEESLSVPIMRAHRLPRRREAAQQIDEIARWMELNWGDKPHFSCFGWGSLTD